jgi:hypothetical protein
MNDKTIICPQCRQSDKTYKVSLLYLEGTERLNHRETQNQPELNALIEDLLPGGNQPLAQSQLVARLVKNLTPPQGEKKVTRRLNPDSTVIFFGLIMLIVLYQVAVSRSSQAPILAVLLTGGLLAYLLARKTVVQRYAERVRHDQEETARVERAIGIWMRLHFCGRDQCVFDPDTDQFVSPEDIHRLLE